MKFGNKLQLFANPDYCDFSATAASAVAGKDILVCVWDASGSELLAIAGQQGLTLNRSADEIEVSSKDTEGGWKSKIAGMKDWGIELNGLYVASDASHKRLSSAFNAGDVVCVVVKNHKTGENLFGGLAAITDYPLEAPYDDAMTYSITLSGNGPITDLSDVEEFGTDPAEITVAKGGSGTAAIVGAEGTVTAVCGATGVTASVSGSTVTVSVTSGATADSYASVVLTDGDTGDTCILKVHVVAAA